MITLNINASITKLINTTKKYWCLTDKVKEPILNGTSLTALVSPQCDAEISTSKLTGVNAPQLAFFYVRCFMAEYASDFGRLFPVSGSTNLYALPPLSISTDGGSSFIFTGDC